MVFLFLFLALFFSCTKNTKEAVDVYARVGETTLTKKDVLEMKKSLRNCLSYVPHINAPPRIAIGKLWCPRPCLFSFMRPLRINVTANAATPDEV